MELFQGAMRRRRINIPLRQGATLTEGIDRRKAYKTIMNGITKVEEFVLCVITVVVTAITFINVLSRYVFHSNFAWSEELVINVFILMIMFGCGLCTQRGQHDHPVPDLRQRRPSRARRSLTAIGTVVNLVFYSILIYTGFDKVPTRSGPARRPSLWAGLSGCLPSCCPSARSSWALHAIEYLIDVLHGDAACVQTAETEGGNN